LKNHLLGSLENHFPQFVAATTTIAEGGLWGDGVI
jgi:hypothetical protein